MGVERFDACAWLGHVDEGSDDGAKTAAWVHAIDGKNVAGAKGAFIETQVVNVASKEGEVDGSSKANEVDGIGSIYGHDTLDPIAATAATICIELAIEEDGPLGFVIGCATLR